MWKGFSLPRCLHTTLMLAYSVYVRWKNKHWRVTKRFHIKWWVLKRQAISPLHLFKKQNILEISCCNKLCVFFKKIFFKHYKNLVNAADQQDFFSRQQIPSQRGLIISLLFQVEQKNPKQNWFFFQFLPVTLPNVQHSQRDFSHFKLFQHTNWYNSTVDKPEENQRSVWKKDIFFLWRRGFQSCLVTTAHLKITPLCASCILTLCRAGGEKHQASPNLKTEVASREINKLFFYIFILRHYLTTSFK